MLDDCMCVSDDKAPVANATAENVTASSNVTDDDSDSSSSSSSSSSSLTTRPAAVHRDIYAESVSSQQPDEPVMLEDSEAARVDEVAYQKLRGAKETMFTKLKNRIRTLEDNLNLTNRSVTHWLVGWLID